MILITGAFGQVGKILQERLASKNKLILVDRSFDKNFQVDSSSEFMIGDLQDIEFVKSEIDSATKLPLRLAPEQ